MKNAFRLVPVLLAAAACVSCAARSDRLDPKAPIGAVVPDDEGYSAVESRDGRTYLIGKKATHASFARGAEMQMTKTFVGAGPNGETVVVEVDPLLPEMTARLTAEFSRTTKVDLR